MIAKHRWPLVLAGALGFAGLMRRFRSFSGDQPEEFVPWMVAAGVFGGIVTFVFVYFFCSGDFTLAAIRRKNPGGVVIQADIKGGATEAIDGIEEWGLRKVPLLLTSVTMSFDEIGFSAWSGGRKPTAMAVVPWRAIHDIGIVPNALGRKNEPDSLAIVFDDAGETTTMTFAVDRSESIRFDSKLIERELAELVQRINAVRGVNAGTVIPSFINTEPATTFLDSRPSAWSASTRARFVRFPLSVFVISAIVAGIVLDSSGQPELGIVVAAIGIILAMVGFLGVHSERAAIHRERALGYTTLNGRELHMIQRHPTTGKILRAPGDMPLSDSDFDERLRDRSL